LLLLECYSDGRLSVVVGQLEVDAGQLAAAAGWLLPVGPLLVGRSVASRRDNAGSEKALRLKG